jgi:hypothetical protein
VLQYNKAFVVCQWALQIHLEGFFLFPDQKGGEN